MTRLLSTNEAAALLRINPQTLYRWRKDDKGPRWTHVGRKVFYEREVLDAWLVENRSQPAKAA